MPQSRQALGLGLVIAAGLLYVAAGFAIQVITKSGVSSFLVSYISTCLFVLHLPCVAIVRCCRRGGFRRAFDFRELLPEDKTSDGEGALERGYPQRWEEQAEAEGGESGGIKGADGVLSGLVQGARLGRVSMDGMGGEGREGTVAAALPLGPVESFAASRSGGASELQTHILGVLDARKEGPHGGKLVELTPGMLDQLGNRGEVETGVMGRAQTEQVGAVGQGLTEPDLVLDVLLLSDHQGSGSPEAGQSKAVQSPEPRVSAYAGLGGAGKLGPFSLCAEHLEAVKVAAAVGPLWFLAQYTYTLSLTLTTVTSNTILFSSTSLFTLLTSVIWLKEPFTFFKLGMIACAILGTVVVSVSDARSATESDGPAHSASGAALGNALTLLAAVVYALYGTCMKYMNPGEVEEEDSSLSPASKQVSNRVSTSLVFGYMGLLGGVFLLPCLFLLYWIGVESLQWMGARTFGLLILKALFGNVIADYLCARAMLLTSPTAASVGLAFQTPVAIVADLVIFGIVPKPLMLVGGVLVMWGFLGINFDSGRSKAPISGL